MADCSPSPGLDMPHVKSSCPRRGSTPWDLNVTRVQVTQVLGLRRRSLYAFANLDQFVRHKTVRFAKATVGTVTGDVVYVICGLKESVVCAFAKLGYCHNAPSRAIDRVNRIRRPPHVGSDPKMLAMAPFSPK